MTISASNQSIISTIIANINQAALQVYRQETRIFTNACSSSVLHHQMVEQYAPHHQIHNFLSKKPFLLNANQAQQVEDPYILHQENIVSFQKLAVSRALPKVQVYHSTSV